MIKLKHTITLLFLFLFFFQSLGQEEESLQNDSTTSEQVNTESSQSKLETTIQSQNIQIEDLNNKIEALTSQKEELGSLKADLLDEIERLKDELNSSNATIAQVNKEKNDLVLENTKLSEEKEKHLSKKPTGEKEELLSSSDILKANLDNKIQLLEVQLDSSKTELEKILEENNDLKAANIELSKEKDTDSFNSSYLTIASLVLLSIIITALIFLIWKHSKSQKVLLKTLEGKADASNVNGNGEKIIELKNQKVDEKVSSLQGKVLNDIASVKEPVDKILIYIDEQIPKLKEQGNSLNLETVEKLKDLKVDIQQHLEEVLEVMYNKESYFLTPHSIMPTEEMKLLGEFLSMEGAFEAEPAYKAFYHKINDLDKRRDTIKESIQKINTEEKSIESQLLKQAYERLRKYKEFIKLAAEEITDGYEQVYENDVIIEGEREKMNGVGSDEQKEIEHEINRREAIKRVANAKAGRLLKRLEKTGLAEIFEDEIGEKFDGAKHIPAIGSPIANNDPKKNQTIYKSVSPGIKNGDEILACQRVITYDNAKGTKVKGDDMLYS